MKRFGIYLVPLLILSLTESGRGEFLGRHHPGSCGAAGCGACADCGPAPPAVECASEIVEKTILVPTWTTEARTVHVTKCRAEHRTKTVPVTVRVPKTESVTRTYFVCVPHERTKTVTRTVMKPHYEDVVREFTVWVPHQEERQGTRTVCRLEPTRVTRTICRDLGHWEEVAAACCPVPGCGGCSGCCPTTRKVWVPKLVREEVPFTVMRPVREQVPCTYRVTVCKPETRTMTVRACKYLPEQQTKEVRYTEWTREPREQTFNVTRYECVVEYRDVPCTVMVPYTEERQVQVRVCKLVPKSVRVRVYRCGRCEPADCCGAAEPSTVETYAAVTPTYLPRLAGWFRRWR